MSTTQQEIMKRKDNILLNVLNVFNRSGNKGDDTTEEMAAEEISFLAESVEKNDSAMDVNEDDSMEMADNIARQCDMNTDIADIKIPQSATSTSSREPEWVRKTDKRQRNYQKTLNDSKSKETTAKSQIDESTSSINRKVQIPRLMESLVENEIVNRESIVKAMEIQRNGVDKRRWLDILVEDFGVDREKLFREVARYYNFDIVDPTAVMGNKDRLRFIKQALQSLSPFYYEMAVRRKVLPYELYTNGYDKLIVITPDTTHADVHTVAKAFQFQKYEIKFVTLNNWNELWRQLAFDQGAKQLGLDVGDFVESKGDDYDRELEKSLEEEVGRGKLSELVEGILIDAVRTGASDIHVVPKGSFRTEFHFRIDGQLSLWSAITDVRAEAIISVIKDRGKNLDRFEKFLSQDGYAQRVIDNTVIRFRFSTMPIYGSDMRSKLESVVIRILRGSETTTGVESLGMQKEQLDVFLKAINKPQGMVIFTGPTGSGKSTCQVASIKTIMDPSLNIVTIEDPVEYLIDGCRQIKLNHKLDFEGALRGLLRHDPDVVVIGEMRDKVTAEMAVKLANTGHLTFSTLHTNDSVSAITRLYNMGIEPFLLAYTINAIVAQRLVRKLCDRCKMVDENVDVDLLTEFGLSTKEIEETTFYKPVGCGYCIKGYRGRTGIFEVLTMTKEMRQTILKSKDCVDEDALRAHALKNGMHTLKDSALNLVKQGIISIDIVAGLAIED
ncbi:MAG TPA: GspE/PulE family protein [Bacteroidota bacterium]|nr:GspE/PulE family protein [Bacteroidota bacterium]